MLFPPEMVRARRWMVRRRVSGTNNKRPYSVLGAQPDGYKPKDPSEYSTAWRWRWNQRCVWSGYDEAKAYLEAHGDTTEGLSFVCHPGGDDGLQDRIICLDFDHSLDEEGKPWPWIQDILDSTESYVEKSRSGKGLHLFLVVECKPFTNMPQQKHEQGGAIEVLCSSQVAVTGNPHGELNPVRKVPFGFIEKLPFFEFRQVQRAETDQDFSEWWGVKDEGLDTDKHKGLTRELLNWEHAVKDHGRSKTTMAAACHIVRNGVTGWDAYHLMQLVPCSPALDDFEIKHKLEDAYAKTQDDGTFAGGVPEFEPMTADAIADALAAMGVVESAYQPKEKQKKPDKRDERGYYNLIPAIHLREHAKGIEWLVDGMIVKRQMLALIGFAKTFKTSISLDLCISLASGTPFLGHFHVPEKQKVAIFTAEIGFDSAVNTLDAICRNRGFRFDDLDLAMSPVVPNVSMPDMLEQFFSDVELYKPTFLMLDPFSRMSSGVDHRQLGEATGALQTIETFCSERGITWGLNHHTNRAAQMGERLGLSNISGAGVAEFARQFILLNHATPYKDGIADLLLDFGGSAGQSGDDLKLKIDVGIIDELNTDRHWNVEVYKQDQDFDDEELVTMQFASVQEFTLKDMQAFVPIEKDRVKNALSRLRDKGVLTFIGGSYVVRDDQDIDTL